MNFRIAKFTHDPIKAVALVLSAAPGSKLRLRRKNVALLYCLDETGQLGLSQVDPVSALVLMAVGGVGTVRQVISKVRLAGLADVPPRAFRKLFEEAVKAGVLRLESKRCV
jgi:hypothetical protein